jgi:hypothetical protein
MNCMPESDLRKQADLPTTRMLNLWQSLCKEKLGTPIEVLVANRREFPYYGINTHQGEMNTAMPLRLGNRLVFVLILASTKKIDMIIVTHELGHSVIKLQGLKMLMYRNDRSYWDLGELCSHPALYVLQRSLGHDPQKEIDRKVAHDIASLRTKIETADEKTNIEKSFYYADDLINCSRSYHNRLERILNNKLPRTAEFVKKILEVKSSRDISRIEQVLPFSKEVVQKLGLAGNWSEYDEVEYLKSKIAELKAP